METIWILKHASQTITMIPAIQLSSIIYSQVPLHHVDGMETLPV